ncbi:MAG: hypothetical protein NTY74_05625 [Ignavibacteriae bacterium]|nr:hypothetical protein [Ignavibacteriota bacterium]
MEKIYVISVCKGAGKTTTLFTFPPTNVALEGGLINLKTCF